MASQPPGPMSLGGAVLATAGHHYTSGYVSVRTAPSQPAQHDLAALRHGLAHALGLGHAARPILLMHHRVPAGQHGYGPGDRHGLALLGQGRPIGNCPSPHRHPRSFLCAV